MVSSSLIIKLLTIPQHHSSLFWLYLFHFGVRIMLSLPRCLLILHHTCICFLRKEKFSYRKINLCKISHKLECCELLATNTMHLQAQLHSVRSKSKAKCSFSNDMADLLCLKAKTGRKLVMAMRQPIDTC